MAGEYVIKQWIVTAEPKQPPPPLVSISGRAPGLLAWFLNLIGLDPTISMDITQGTIAYTASNLRGHQTRIIPLKNVSSTYYGFEKPIELLVVAIVFLLMGFPPLLAGLVGGAGMGSTVMGFLLGAIGALAFLKFLMSKALTLAVVEGSGEISAIRFKGSVIEGIKVDEHECQKVSLLIKELAEALH